MAYTEPDSGFRDDPPPWRDRPAFALDADVTVWWPEVRPCWEEVTSEYADLRA